MHFYSNETAPWVELGDGIRRKIVGHTPQLMSVLVQFDQGAIGTPHAHDVHDQIAYVVSGSFECSDGGCGTRSSQRGLPPLSRCIQ